MTCARYADLDFVERYVLGQMDDAEQASFEAHYFECPDCFAAVQALQTAQSVLRDAPAASHQPVPAATTPPSRVVDFQTHPARGKNGDAGTGRSGRPRLLSSAGTWIGLAAAASLAGVMIWTPWRSRGAADSPRPEATLSQQTPPAVSPNTSGSPNTAAQPTTANPTASNPATPTPDPSTSQPSGTGAAATRPAARPTISLDTLALLTPPPYLPLQTRGPGAGSHDAFNQAMTKYSAKDYRAAIDALKPIVDAQPEAMHAAFYLGVSYLAAGNTDAATTTLTRVAASNVTPFADEAHFYLAKAALRTHDTDRAERELTTAIERQAGPPNEAAKLLQSLRTYRRDHVQN